MTLADEVERMKRTLKRKQMMQSLCLTPFDHVKTSMRYQYNSLMRDIVDIKAGIDGYNKVMAI